MSKPTGGCAFPDPGRADPDFTSGGENTEGMTLRDYFAAQSLSALITGIGAQPFWEDPVRGAAKRAYELADAMIEARDAT